MPLDPQLLIKTLQTQIEQWMGRQHIDQIVMVGIRTGGVWIAERLHSDLGLSTPLGILDISFYRDDFSRIGLHPEVHPSNIPVDITDQHIVLVDDVLYTGRTIRAALNELFDYGRPASVRLAVMIDRGDRELPIDANMIGTRMELHSNQQIKCSLPENAFACRVLTQTRCWTH